MKQTKKTPSRTAKQGFKRFDDAMKALKREYNGTGAAGKASRPSEERRQNTAGEANNVLLSGKRRNT